MVIVYIEGWPKGRPVHDYTIENAAGQILKSAKTLDEAIAWAKQNGHEPRVAGKIGVNDKTKPEHWRGV